MSKNPKGAGRPHKKIDWELVDQLLLAGCNGMEIAPHFNIHSDTFYEACKEKYGMYFSEYQSQLLSKGNGCIRETQYKKAIAGDNTMLIWLGKNRLGQRESPVDIGVDKETLSKFNDLMDMFTKKQEEAQQARAQDNSKIAESVSNNDK